MIDDVLTRAGWDIGGAHVKLAYIEDNELFVHQWDCPLWKGLDELVSIIHKAKILIPESIINHHVTMTGELVDVFISREQGVQEIMRVFFEQFPLDDNVRIFSRTGLVDHKTALLDTLSIASANWIASGLCVGRNNDDIIFVDIGSTTTDVLSVKGGQLELNGLSDFERLCTSELVYTGVVRSCVNTICQKIPYKGSFVPLMAEYFAVSADIYRILGWLPDHADYGNTTDGQPKDKTSSMRRLARMIGEDYREQDKENWISVAEYIAIQQMKMVEESIKNQVKTHDDKPKIVGAGIGRFLIKKIANELLLDYQEFAQYIIPPGLNYDANCSDCAPAVALVFQS
ncbi:MAG: hydantoinase/oxoprolinase family protein [Gammaproteobacteria bacterium]|nr:hydantoinase/oxoprolinase family protein [Gammaproteobacteria bacterium]